MDEKEYRVIEGEKMKQITVTKLSKKEKYGKFDCEYSIKFNSSKIYFTKSTLLELKRAIAKILLTK